MKKSLIVDQSYYKWKKDKSAVSLDTRAKVVKATVEYILMLISDRIKKPIKELKVLDVGSGSGEYSFEFAKKVKFVVGVEPYATVFKQSNVLKKKNGIRNVKFYNNLIEDFNTNTKFDLAISLSTIEHMANAEQSFARVFKLLNKGGYLYLTGPNRLWPYENHYRLPLLSWFPLPIASLYVRIMGRGDSYKDSSYSRTYFGMRKLFDDYKCKYELIVPDPEASFIGLGYGSSLYHLLKKIGINLIKKFPIFWFFSKGFIFLAKK